MKFLIDVQLPITLARWLKGRGYNAVHALELNLGTADDSGLWVVALREQRIMISKDEDFFILANRPEDQGKLLWIRLGNCRTATLLTLLNKRWLEIEEAFQSGQQIVEIR